MAEPQRRRTAGTLDAAVHDVIARAGRPCSGLEIVAALRDTGMAVGPSQVFRALRQLRRKALIRKIELIDRYVTSGASAPFDLVCDICGGVRTLAAPDLAGAIGKAARATGFMPGVVIIEMGGRCRRCTAG